MDKSNIVLAGITKLLNFTKTSNYNLSYSGIWLSIKKGALPLVIITFEL